MMKTEKQYNYDILKISMAIADLFPELSKYIEEMPVKLSYKIGSEKNIKNLSDYYDSLYALLTKYNKNHLYEIDP